MSRNRLLFLLVAMVLLAGVALTVRGAFATSTNVSTAMSVAPGSAQPPELHNSAQAPNPAGYWNIVTSASTGMTQGAGRPPELYSSQAPNPAGYWDTISPASSGLNQGAARPRRCTVPLEGGNWLATGTC
jgi:hypothetical protein